MTDNQVISEWYHKKVKIDPVKGLMFVLKFSRHDSKKTCRRWSRCPDYSTDPAAWAPELYQKIEDEGLIVRFIEELDKAIATYVPAGITEGTWSLGVIWRMIKATPQQKAQTLARAIKEVEG